MTANFRYVEWKEALTILRGVRQHGPNMVRIQGPVMELMTCALAQDERCFHMDRLPQDWKDLQLQIRGEQGRTDAIGPNAKPTEVATIFKVLLTQGQTYPVGTHSETGMGQSQACHVCYHPRRFHACTPWNDHVDEKGFLRQLEGHFGEACANMRRAIAIIEAIDREFPLSSALDAETRGSTFQPTLVRSFILLLANAICRVHPSFT
jgi:hypothetical protein